MCWNMTWKKHIEFIVICKKKNDFAKSSFRFLPLQTYTHIAIKPKWINQFDSHLMVLISTDWCRICTCPLVMVVCSQLILIWHSENIYIMISFQAQLSIMLFLCHILPFTAPFFLSELASIITQFHVKLSAAMDPVPCHHY